MQVTINQNTLENAKNLKKKLEVRSDDDIFEQISAKCANFEVSSVGLALGVFDEVSVSCRNFNQVSISVSKVTVSTTSLIDEKNSVGAMGVGRKEQGGPWILKFDTFL